MDLDLSEKYWHYFIPHCDLDELKGATPVTATLQ